MVFFLMVRFYQANMYNLCRNEKNIDFILFICHNGLEYDCQGVDE